MSGRKVGRGRGRAKRELPESWLSTEEKSHCASPKSPSHRQLQRSCKSPQSTLLHNSQSCEDTSSGSQGPSDAANSDVSAAICHSSTVQGSPTSVLNRLITAGRGQDALHLLTELQDNSKSCGAEVEVYRGHVFLSLGRVSEAAACFLAALSEHPRNEQALCAVGKIHLSNGDMNSCYEVCFPS
jgi:hypothetical protein